jgi:phage terminase small subunit
MGGNMLTPKQKRFVDEYTLDLNGAAAYERAGYRGKGATAEACSSRMLSNAKVAQAVSDAIERRSERTQADAELVVRGILDTIERCRQARPVLNRKGEPVMVRTPSGELAPAYTFEAMAVLKGYELLGKHSGMFTDKTEISGPEGAAIPVINVTIG